MDLNLNDLQEKYGARKPTIRARIKKLERENPEAQLTYRIDNVIYLTSLGSYLLEEDVRQTPFNNGKGKRKKSAEPRKPLPDREIPSNKENSTEAGKIEPSNENETLIILLREQIELLKNELQARKKENRELLGIIRDLNETLAQTLTQSQTLTSQAQTLTALDQKAKSINPPQEAPASITPEQRKQGNRKSLTSKLITAVRVIKGEFD